MSLILFSWWHLNRKFCSRILYVCAHTRVCISKGGLRDQYYVKLGQYRLLSIKKIPNKISISENIIMSWKWTLPCKGLWTFSYVPLSILDPSCHLPVCKLEDSQQHPHQGLLCRYTNAWKLCHKLLKGMHIYKYKYMQTFICIWNLFTHSNKFPCIIFSTNVKICYRAATGLWKGVIGRVTTCKVIAIFSVFHFMITKYHCLASVISITNKWYWCFLCYCSHKPWLQDNTAVGHYQGRSARKDFNDVYKVLVGLDSAVPGIRAALDYTAVWTNLRWMKE